jgi:hypothetical protein
MAITDVTLFRGANGTTQGAIRPVRPGWRPFDGRLRGKRYGLLQFSRNSPSGTTATYATVGVLGIDLPYDTAAFGVAANGQILPGNSPNLSGLTIPPSVAGTYVQKIKISGGSAAGIGLITVVDGGSGVSAAPTVVFTGGGGSSAAATAIIRDERVVGITITNAGSGYTSAPVITFTGGTMITAPQAVCGIGQQVTVNTNIPYVVHAPLALGGQFWFATVEGPHGSRILMCNTSAVAAFNNVDDGALDPDQHIMGTSSNAGFTLASGTNPDGTLTCGILTLAAGLPNGTVVNVYSGTVREVSAQLNHVNDRTQVKAIDLMWAVVGGSSDNSLTSIDLMPNRAE